jgi:hypothetical protein
MPGNFGTLIEQEGDLKLLVEGEMFRPHDDLRGGTLEVNIAEPQKAGHLAWFKSGIERASTGDTLAETLSNDLVQSDTTCMIGNEEDCSGPTLVMPRAI